MTAETRQLSKVWPLGLLIAVVVISGGVLVGGWGLGIEALIRLRPDYAAMAPSTAICLLALAAPLILSETGMLKGGFRLAALMVSAVLAAAIAGVDLILIASRFAPGIDHLIWPDAEAFKAGSMAPATAICVLLAANGVFDVARPTRSVNVRVVSATAGLLLTAVALVGYAFDERALYSVSIFTAMALHTALGFGLLFVALLLLRPHAGWVDILSGPEVGSKGARRLLPIVVAVPFFLCLAALAATHTGWLSVNFRLSLLAIIMMVLLVATVLRNAALENAAERKLRDALADRELLLRELYHRVKNNLQQINALLRIESDTLTDADAKASFLAMSERIQALGTVHRLLISSSQPSRCDTAEFLEELCDGLAASRGAPGAAIRIEVNADHWEVPIDEAITLGLLVNELVVNALKHAFEGRSDGRVVVGYLIQPNADALLTVVDDGSGMPASEGWPSDGAGGRIIRGLVAQLKGTICVRAAAGRTRGAIVEVRLPRSDQE